MTDQLRACAHCGGKPVDLGKDWVRCESEFCVSKLLCFKTKDWQNRPIEDKLRSDLAVAVEALKDLSNSHLHPSDEPPSEYCPACDADEALQKIGGGDEV